MQYCEVELQNRQFEEHREVGYTVRCPAKCEGSHIKESHHFRIMGQDKVCNYMYTYIYIYMYIYLIAWDIGQYGKLLHECVRYCPSRRRG